jgi:hypothetical protein
MAAQLVVGSFSLGFFVPNWDLYFIDSGLPEWTLGEDGTPPAEPTEEDAEDDDDGEDEDSGYEHSGDEKDDDGYDADDEDDGDCGLVVDDEDDDDYDDDDDYEEDDYDEDDYDEDLEYFLSTLPTLDESEEEGEDELSDDNEYDYDDDAASLPLLDTDSGTWTLESDEATTEHGSIDEVLNNAVIRPTSPDINEIFAGLNLDGQRLDPDFELYTNSVNLPAPDAEQPPLWDSARPIEAYWVDEVMRFMELEDMRRWVLYHRVMGRRGGYEIDEDDQPSE